MYPIALQLVYLFLALFSGPDYFCKYSMGLNICKVPFLYALKLNWACCLCCLFSLVSYLFFVCRSVHFWNGCTEARGRGGPERWSATTRPGSPAGGVAGLRGAEPGCCKGLSVPLPGGGIRTQWGPRVGLRGGRHPSTPPCLPRREPQEQVSALTLGPPLDTRFPTPPSRPRVLA